MRTKPILEVCTGSLQSVINAVEGGAERIELCSALALGGLTPSLGLVQKVRTLYPKLKINVLIRVREGNFVYTEQEIQTMEQDIEAILPYCDAIVCGALTCEGYIDSSATARFLKACKGKPFTFHRAFDHCKNSMRALDELIALGCTRVLTSGQMPSAEAGIPNLKAYVQHVGNRLIILPGAGVNPSNAHFILTETGTTEIHGSGAITLEDGRIETQTETIKGILNDIN